MPCLGAENWFSAVFDHVNSSLKETIDPGQTLMGRLGVSRSVPESGTKEGKVSGGGSESWLFQGTL